MQIIKIKPREKGTAVVEVAPTDENGDSLSFIQLSNAKWQLMNMAGQIINDRSFDKCLLTSLTWVLKGNDLAIFGSSDSGKRILSFQASYDSSIGTDLPLNAECYFSINKFLGQTDEA